MTEIITPITADRNLPKGVPLVASFNDNRNRLSYYHPIIKQIDGVRTPITEFHKLSGSLNTVPQIDCRPLTEFMQEVNLRKAFIRGDYSSGKLSQQARVVQSQDPVVINQCIAKLVSNLMQTGRHIGEIIAIREFIPHETEIRYFISNGKINYHEKIDKIPKEDLPTEQVQAIAEVMDTFAWSVDLIKHQKTGKWYCIDMGLDGLYYNEQTSSWIAISEHPDKNKSPEQYSDDMPNMNALKKF